MKNELKTIVDTAIVIVTPSKSPLVPLPPQCQYIVVIIIDLIIILVICLVQLVGEETVEEV